MDGRSVVAVVPAYNEADRVGGTVVALRSIPEVRGVLVVDDGSGDPTSAQALTCGAAVIRIEANLGKGGALNAGVAALRARVRRGAMRPPRALLLADADLGPSAAGLRPLIRPVLTGRADLAIGDLPSQEGSGGFGIAMRLARFGIRRFGGIDVREPLSGQRAVAWSALGALYPFAGRFGVEIAMTIDALTAGLQVAEIKVDVGHRATAINAAGVTHRFAQARAITRELLSRQIARRRATEAGCEMAWTSFGD